jgi:N-acetylmuramoyl-L-alanine amidase
MRRVLLSIAILALWLPSAAADVTGVRAAVQPGGGRIAIDLKSTAPYRVFALANPARIVVDLPNMKWRTGGLPGSDSGIASLRHGLFRPDVYRLVFDLKQQAAIRTANLIGGRGGVGKRLVVDLAFGKAPNQKRFGSLRPKAENPVVQAPRRPRERVIVVDAGHGGIDPGASGVGGVIEKHVNLAVAKALKRILEARPGYQVHLTRSTDIFLKLRERVRRGRARNADLFLSIHADSHPDKDISGASLYTLSEKASDREADRLARAENKADSIGGVEIKEGPREVVGILINLAQRDTKNRSSAVADDLLFALATTQPLLRTPKRAAGFVVLKAPDVPSVLIELGFLSNAEDAKRLARREGREDIARAIAAGIARYFDGANTARALQSN